MNEERRTVKITREQATRWYHSKDETLKQLALSAFSKEELARPSFETIERETSEGILWDIRKYQKLQYKLRVLSYYFNDSSYNRVGTPGYFLQRADDYPRGYAKPYRIAKHDTVVQSGVIYFQNEEDLREALHYFTEEELNLLVKP